MFVLILDLVEDFHTVEERRLHRIFCGLAYGKPVPRITPHVLRHTFCTNVQQAGLDVKSLQYLMGHSNASVTLDVYTHSSFDSVERAFEQIASSL